MKKTYEVIFFWGLLFLEIKTILDFTEIIDVPDMISNLFMFLGYICMAFTVIQKKKKLTIYHIIIIILGVISYIISHYTGLLTLSLILVASYSINIKRIIKFIFKFNILILAIHIILYIIYYFLDFNILDFNSRFGSDNLRHKFLFTHANTFATYFSWTYLMYLYIKFEKINTVDYISIVAVALFIYIFPNSRTSSFIMIISLVLIIICKYAIKKKKDIIIKILKQGIIFCAIFSIIALILYGNNNFINFVDTFFSARIKLARACYEYYGMSLFGEELPLGRELEYMPEFGLNGLTLDSVYYSLLFSYGIISFAVVIWLLHNTANRTRNKKKIIFLDILALSALMETATLNPLIGFPLLFINQYIQQKEKLNARKSINNNSNIQFRKLFNKMH